MESGEWRRGVCGLVFLITHHSPLVTRHFFGGEPDVTSLIGVLGRVAEQVHHDLFQPRRIGVQPDRFRRQ